jgi:tricorn protease
MSLDGMAVEISPRQEWQQLFTEVWRVERDFFYVANMHGVDWAKMRDLYAPMLADCVCRDDVSQVIKELIAELNVGHAYYWAGDVDQGPSVSVGLLGVDFELSDGAYRIARIYGGAPWDVDARGPLTRLGTPGGKDEKSGKADKGDKVGKGGTGKKGDPHKKSDNGEDAGKEEKDVSADKPDAGVPAVKEGDYLLAVNRVRLDPAKDPWAAFQGLAGKTVILTVSSRPQIDDQAREVVVELRGSEADLRYRAWVERNRAYVEEKSAGQVGYIHVPDTGTDGQSELFRQFFGQRDLKALIVDDRWNGGGQVPDRFIELLNRPLYNYWARRHGHDTKTPGYSHQGPNCMLINGLAGSGGDAFPTYFRLAGLGPLVGMRTWGGLVGISGNPTLIDNVFVTVPTFGYYKPNGTWGIEGHGVDPDVLVIDDPALMQDGKDPQLDKAIALMLRELELHPPVPPARPADPNRSGMGSRVEDR